jgi:hypothetical protein
MSHLGKSRVSLSVSRNQAIADEVVISGLIAKVSAVTPTDRAIGSSQGGPSAVGSAQAMIKPFPNESTLQTMSGLNRIPVVS